MADGQTAGPPSVAQVFDTLAGVYDQTGVEFFGPVGQRLVSLLEPRAGERCLDVGCGRGAVTLPLARSVGPSGSVKALDISTAMVAGTKELVRDAGLTNVTVEVGDAADLSSTVPGFDVVASSLVLFFLPDPAAALRTWVARLVSGGRIGLTTFGRLDEPTQAIDALVDPYAPPRLRDPRTTGADDPFASDKGMEDLLADAGASDVRTVGSPSTLEFADVTAWEQFAMSTGQRAMLVRVPEDEKADLLGRISAILEATRVDGGPCRLVWEMRYTLGVR